MPRANRMGCIGLGLLLIVFLTIAGQALAAEPGQIPLEYPVAATTATEGEYVLAPPRL